MEQKTVFISYRRSMSKHLARAIYMDLRAHGWDVFLDVNTIDSGDFDRIILNQIGARAHFILLISPDSLKRCANSGDWVLREIQEAVRLERNIVPIVEEGADFSREMEYLPSDLRAIISKKSALPLTHFYFDAAVETLRTRFLKTPEYVTITAPPPAERAAVQRRMAATLAELGAIAQRPDHSLLMMPAPFAWIEIPNRDYRIAKYPITNAQFAKFIEAGGYRTERWWTKEGWQRRAEGWHYDGEWKRSDKAWTHPLYWKDSKWNGAEQPVVGVSWYEAIAYCLWLSEVAGVKVMLPTEAQWQYAAQGDDGRAYPWGDDWDCRRCNNSVNPCKNKVTSPVRQYEGKGNSPFGVVDMAGNVREWCVINNSGIDNATGKRNDSIRMLFNSAHCGGSWRCTITDNFRCRPYIYPAPLQVFARYDDVGFRIAC